MKCHASRYEVEDCRKWKVSEPIIQKQERQSSWQQLTHANYLLAHFRREFEIGLDREPKTEAGKEPKTEPGTEPETESEREPKIEPEWEPKIKTQDRTRVGTQERAHEGTQDQFGFSTEGNKFRRPLCLNT